MTAHFRSFLADMRHLGMLVAAALVIAVGLSISARTGFASDSATDQISLSHAWIRFIIPGRPAAGYFTLRNEGATPIDLVGASSPGCGKMMLHKSVHQQDGSETMVMVARIRVPEQGSLTFAPGGFHLMCMNPNSQVSPGATVPVTLKFDDGTSITKDFPVKNALGN